MMIIKSIITLVTVSHKGMSQFRGKVTSCRPVCGVCVGGKLHSYDVSVCLESWPAACQLWPSILIMQWIGYLSCLHSLSPFGIESNDHRRSLVANGHWTLEGNRHTNKRLDDPSIHRSIDRSMIEVCLHILHLTKWCGSSSSSSSSSHSHSRWCTLFNRMNRHQSNE